MASLSYRSAAKIASREMRSSRGKFLFVLLSVAIGVAALTGVRGFSASFRTTLLLRARSIMAADLSARTFQQLTPEEQRSIDSIRSSSGGSSSGGGPGLQTTTVTEMISMASSPTSPDPLLVSIKAIDPALYPFYGSVDLAPSLTLPAALTPNSVAVGEDLLLRLNLHVGDPLKLGNQTLRISASIVNEPDRLSSNFTLGPRVLLSRTALASTGLLAPGNRASERILFKLQPTQPGQPVSDSTVASLKTQLIAALPEAQVTDYRESSPAITNGLDAATSLLSLMSLVALVLGAVGVAMAMRAHLAQRLDTIAIMKSLGARSSQIIKIYLLQTLFLGVLGGLIGVAGGVAVQLAFPLVIGKLLNVPSDFHFQLRAVLTGLAAGVLITLLFTLPPLLDIRNVRPILILRRAVEDSDDPFLHAALKKISSNIAQILATVLIVAGIAAVAVTLSDSPKVGIIFSIGLVVILLILIGVSSGLLATLKFLLNRTRLHLPSALRHGLANLYRPGNPSAALLAALGLGVMQIMTVYLVQKNALKEMNITVAPNIPNVFLIDIADSEIAGVKTLLHAQTSVSAEPELLPITTAQLSSIDGVPTASVKLKNFPRRMLRSINLTWNDVVPPGTKVIDGAWWRADETKPVVAISEGMATRLGIHVGSAITFVAQDKPIAATVTAITRANGQHAYARAEFTLNHAALRGLPIIWYGGVHVIPAQVAEFVRALNHSYPTITIINVAQVVESIRVVVVQIIYVVQFLSGFSIFAGIIILASSIAGTRYRRIREVVVLKTLGATRARIAAIFSIEFAVLGLVAGAVGILFANLIAWAIETRTPMHLTYKPELAINLLALVAASTLTVATGWIASHRILGQKPLEVLREE